MRITRRHLILRSACAGLISALAFGAATRGQPAGASELRWRPLAAPIGGLPPEINQVGDQLNLAIAAREAGVILGPRELGPFTGVAVVWRAVGDVEVLIQVRDPSGFWSEWQRLSASQHLDVRSGRAVSDLRLGLGSAVRIRLTFRGGPRSREPVLSNLEVIAIDGRPGPSAPARPSSGTTSALADRPSIISRSGWGCPEPNSSTAWPPTYQPVEKIIVHHTDTATGLDGAQAVRTIYHYHAVVEEWGDIGYNFLIDSSGNIYEGRYGGDDVVGGHALCFNYGSLGVGVIGTYVTTDISSNAESALVNLLAWKCGQRGINPLGSGYFVDRTLANIAGHRDCNGSCGLNTVCPGDRLSANLSRIRTLVSAKTTSTPDREIGERFGAHSTPLGMGTGDELPVTVDVTNVGTMTWTSTAPTRVRLGYKWFRADGTQYVQAPADDRRTDVPRTVPFGETVRFVAPLVAPREPGSYRLRWDLEQAGLRWFEQEPKNRPLDVSILIREPVLALSEAEVAFLATPGRNPSPITIRVLNNGWGQLGWSAVVRTDVDGWLTLAPTSARLPGQLTLVATSVSLAPGVYEGTLTVTADVPGVVVPASPRTIPVRLTVTENLYRVFLPASLR